MSYEALIAAQHKRLTKKRERWSMRSDRYAFEAAIMYPEGYKVLERGEYTPPAIRVRVPDQFNVTSWPYVPPAPRHIELSHAEWADGYKKWLAKRRVPNSLLDGITRHAFYSQFSCGTCFAENEI